MRNLVEIILGVLVGLGLYCGLVWESSDFTPKDFGLGRNTLSFVAEFQSHPISGFTSGIPQISNTAAEFRANNHQVFLWVGASQLHAINQSKAGDQLAVAFANQEAVEHQSPIRFVQISEPNANLHELWSIIHHFVEGNRVDGLVLGFTYDDLRELGVRPELQDYYRQAPIDPTVLNKENLAEDKGIVPTAETPQAQLESFLILRLEELFPAFAQRDKVRAYLEANYKLWVVQLIYTFFKRHQERISPTRIQWNEMALDAILNLTHKRKIPLLIYQAPHQPGLKVFTHPRAEYDAYFSDLQTKLQDYPNVWFVNLETLVPAEYWGINAAGQPDVFHFRVEGHRALGQAVEAAIEKRQPFKE